MGRGFSGLLLLAVLAVSQGAAAGEPTTDSTSVSSPDNDTESTVSVVQGSPQQSSSRGSASNESGQHRVLSYGSILKKVKAAAPGDIVKVLLSQRERGQWVYEFEVLDSAGRLTRLSVNAQTAAIISTTRR